MKKKCKLQFLMIVTLILCIWGPGCSKSPDTKNKSVSFEDTMFLNDTIIAEKDGKYLLLDKQGKERAAFDYISSNCGEGLVVFRQDGRYGYMDLTGKVVVPALYDDANPFTDGLGSVRVNGSWGFVDHSNKMVISPQYSQVGTFIDGICNVKKDDLEFYINTKGEKIFDMDFMSAETFTGNVAVVETKEGSSLINKEGEIITDTYFDDIYMKDIRSWRDTGLLVVKLNGSYGYVSGITGETVIFPVYSDVFEFYEGICRVRIGDKFGAVDANGKIIIDPVYDSLGEFSDGLCSYQEQGKWGFIDKAGKKVIPPTYAQPGDFDNGVARMLLKDGTFHYIDKTGKVVDKPKFKDDALVLSYHAGWGFDDRNGNTVIEGKYAEFSVVNDNRYAMYSNDRIAWILFDHKGNELISFEDYDIQTRNAGDFNNLNIKTQFKKSIGSNIFTDDGYAFIGRGKYWPRRVEQRDDPKTNTESEKSGLGVISINKEVVIQPIYDQLIPFTDIDEVLALLEKP